MKKKDIIILIVLVLVITALVLWNEGVFSKLFRKKEVKEEIIDPASGTTHLDKWNGDGLSVAKDSNPLPPSSIEDKTDTGGISADTLKKPRVFNHYKTKR